MLCAADHEAKVIGIVDPDTELTAFAGQPVAARLKDMGAFDAVIVTDFRNPAGGIRQAGRGIAGGTDPDSQAAEHLAQPTGTGRMSPGAQDHWYVVSGPMPGAEAKALYNLGRQGFEAYLPQYLKRRRHARADRLCPGAAVPALHVRAH